jgi:hypothetical protein
VNELTELLQRSLRKGETKKEEIQDAEKKGSDEG